MRISFLSEERQVRMMSRRASRIKDNALAFGLGTGSFYQEGLQFRPWNTHLPTLKCEFWAR